MPTRPTNAAIVRQTQQLAKLELKLAKHKAKERRLDARNKILWGGLIIKAKLDSLPTETLLGGLLNIEQQLCESANLLDVFKAKGAAVFLGFQSAPNVLTPKPSSWYNVANENNNFFASETTTATAAEMRLAELRQATRRKIQLGGLIIKAKLFELSKAQLLGALVTLASNLNQRPELQSSYYEVGKAALAKQ